MHTPDVIYRNDGVESAGTMMLMHARGGVGEEAQREGEVMRTGHALAAGCSKASSTCTWATAAAAAPKQLR
jgi:hypothetical protein